MDRQIKINKVPGVECRYLPEYSNKGIGVRLFANNEKIVMDGHKNYIEYGSGISIELPTNFYGMIVPPQNFITKSSLFSSEFPILVDTPSVGEVRVRYRVAPGVSKRPQMGECIGILILYPMVGFKLEVPE
jgi:hypothetical protein